MTDTKERTEDLHKNYWLNQIKKSNAFAARKLFDKMVAKCGKKWLKEQEDSEILLHYIEQLLEESLNKYVSKLAPYIEIARSNEQKVNDWMESYKKEHNLS